MKYRVVIPLSKTKRLKNRKIIISYGGGGEFDKKEEEIPTGINFYDFVLPDEYKYKYNTTEIDGLIFDVAVIYTNDDKTRSETKHLVPERIGSV